jgi:hypothetical protein
VWTIEEELFSPSTVIHNDGEAPRGCDHKLLKLLVGVASTYRSRRHIVKVVGALDGERNVAITFDESEIASLIHNLRKIDDVD